MSAAHSNFAPLTLREATQALCCISADLVRDDWVMIAAAMHNEFGDAAFTEFDQWSATGTSYSPQAARDTWRSCRKLTRYGMGSLIALAKKHGWTTPRRHPLTPSEQARIERETAETQRAREARQRVAAQELAMSQAVAAKRARALWDGCVTESGSHPYLQAKRIGTHGTKRGYCDDAEQAPLVVPMRDIDDVLWGLQTIPPDGKGKRYLSGSRSGGSFHAIGEPLPSAKRIIIAEGFATAAS